MAVVRSFPLYILLSSSVISISIACLATKNNDRTTVAASRSRNRPGTARSGDCNSCSQPAYSTSCPGSSMDCALPTNANERMIMMNGTMNGCRTYQCSQAESYSTYLNAGNPDFDQIDRLQCNNEGMWDVYVMANGGTATRMGTIGSRSIACV